MSELDEYLSFAKELAKDAGEIMKQHFRQEASLPEWKKQNDPVTLADKSINSLVIERIKAKFEDHGVLGEEESFNQDAKNLWVVDPIDGTIPYILGLPISTFLLSLVIAGRPVVTVSYNPWINLMHFAQTGKGAFCNDERLNIKAPSTRIVELIMWDGSPFKNRLTDLRERVEAAGLNPQNFAGGNSRYGVAENRLYGVIYSGHDPWDAATLDLLVTEAGGKITDLDGNILDFRKPIKGAVAGNKETHKHLMELIQG